MTEPLSIFTAPPRSEQTAIIPADLLAAYVELQRAAEYQIRYHYDDTVEMLKDTSARVAELSGTHCKTNQGGN